MTRLATLALRMDDPGASSKQNEIYSDWSSRFGPFRISGNWLFLKHLEPFKGWGPYRELRPPEWRSILDLLESKGAKLTVGITAAWAVSNSEQIPFPEKYPQQAAILREAAHAGLIEVANHGYSHCVLESNLFKPQLLSGNRKYHREYWDWVPDEIQENHIARSQEILQNWLNLDVVTFVPPGNVYTDTTLEIAKKYGVRYVSCQTTPSEKHGLQVIGNEDVVPFHDRELVLEGVEWLEDLVNSYTKVNWVHIRDLGRMRESRRGKQ